MPESVFRLSAGRPYNEQMQPFVDARWRLICGDLEPSAKLPMSASTCYVWPAAHCPVKCGHCNFAAPPSVVGLDRFSVARNLDSVLDVVNGMSLWKAVLSGGGEPMVEPDFCRDFINKVSSPELEEIELITSGYFATSLGAADDALDSLHEAWTARDDAMETRPRLTIRLSLDWFHVQRLGIEHAVHLISAVDRAQRYEVGFYIRSVLLTGDSTMVELADRLGAELGPIDDFQRIMRLPSGRLVTVYLKNLILDGRMNRRKLARLPVGLPTGSIEDFAARFRDGRGQHVPARVYNGPAVRHLDGVACIVEDDGAVKILEGTPPDRSASVGEHPSWDSARRYLYADPLSRFLVESGPEPLAELLAPAFPGVRDLASDFNQLYYLTDRLLGDPVKRLYATVKILEQESGHQCDQSAVAQARGLLAGHAQGWPR